MPLDDRGKLFQLYETGTSEISNISCAVKLHPSENKEEYSRFIQRNSHVSIYSQGEISLDVLFEQADLILVHNSSIMFESISKGIPVLILNPRDVSFPVGIGQKLYDMPGYPKIQNDTDLKNYINAIQKDINLLDDLYKICIDFSKDYCHAYDNDAAKNIISFIDSKKNL